MTDENVTPEEMQYRRLANAAATLLEDMTSGWLGDNAEHFNYGEMEKFAELAEALGNHETARYIMLAWAWGDSEWEVSEVEIARDWGITQDMVTIALDQGLSRRHLSSH